MSNLNVGDKVVILDGNEAGVVTAITEDNKVEVMVHGSIKVMCEAKDVTQLLLEVDPNPSCKMVDPNTPEFLSE